MLKIILKLPLKIYISKKWIQLANMFTNGLTLKFLTYNVNATKKVIFNLFKLIQKHTVRIISNLF